MMMFVAVSFSHAQSGFRFIKENDSNKISEVRDITSLDTIKNKTCDAGEWVVIIGGRVTCTNYGTCGEGFVPEGIDRKNRLKCKEVPEIPNCDTGEVVVGDSEGGYACAFAEPINIEECTDGKLVKYISENGKIIPKCVAPLDNQPTSFNNNSENLFSNLVNFILLPLKAQTQRSDVTIGGITEKADSTLEIANGAYSGGGKKLTLKADKFTLTQAADFNNIVSNEHPPGVWCGFFGNEDYRSCPPRYIKSQNCPEGFESKRINNIESTCVKLDDCPAGQKLSGNTCEDITATMCVFGKFTAGPIRYQSNSSIGQTHPLNYYVDCPTNWVRYKSWTTTETGWNNNGYWCAPSGSHRIFSNTVDAGGKGYCGRSRERSTAAIVVGIGCRQDRNEKVSEIECINAGGKPYNPLHD